MCHAGDFLTSGGFPNASSSVITTRDHILPIRAEGDGNHSTVMGHASDFDACRDFPHAGSSVITTGDHILPIRAEGDDNHPTVMSHMGGDFPASRSLPDTNQALNAVEWIDLRMFIA